MNIDEQYNVKALSLVRQNHSHMCFKMVKFFFTTHEQENEKENTTLSVLKSYAKVAEGGKIFTPNTQALNIYP